MAQALFMTATLPVVFAVGRHILARPTAGLMAALLFACSPYFLHSLSNDFHPDSWQMPFLALAIFFFLKEKPVALVLSCLVALLAKEDVSVVVCGFALFLAFKPGWRPTAVVLMALSLLVFFLEIHFLVPHYSGGQNDSILLNRYSHLGGSFGAIARNAIVRPWIFTGNLVGDPLKYWRLFCYLLPGMGLALFAPSYLLPVVVSVLPHLLSQSSTQLSLADIYAMPSEAFLLAGSCVGAVRLMRRFPSLRPWTLAGAALITAGLGVQMSPRFCRNLPVVRLSAFRELRRLIPVNASLAAQQTLEPHFSERRFVQIFPMGFSSPEFEIRYFTNPDFVACDRIGNTFPYDRERLSLSIAALEQDSRYEKIFDRESFLVFRRRTKEPLQWRERE